MKTVLLAQFWTVHLSQRIQQGVFDYMSHHETWQIAEVSAVHTIMKEALDWELDGAIATVVSDPIADIIRQIGCPCVSTGMESYPNIPMVDADNYRAGAKAAEYLLSKPYEQFAVLGNTLLAGHLQRQNGFIDRIISEQKTPAEWHVEIYSASADRSIGMIDGYLAGIQSPTAVYCSDDKSAYYLGIACRQRGIDIPGFVGILASEDEERYCGSKEHALSSLNLPYHDVGYRAAKILDGMMRGESPPPEPVLLDPAGVIERASTL